MADITGQGSRKHDDFERTIHPQNDRLPRRTAGYCQRSLRLAPSTERKPSVAASLPKDLHCLFGARKRDAPKFDETSVSDILLPTELLRFPRETRFDSLTRPST